MKREDIPMHHHAFFVAAILLPTLAVAQTARPEFQLQSGTNIPGNGSSEFNGPDGVRVIAANGDLPADPANGLFATANVVYAFWPDLDSNGDRVMNFLRSTDGGWSWDTSQTRAIWTADTSAGEDFHVRNHERDFGEAQGLFVATEGHSVYMLFAASRDLSGNPDPQGLDSAWVVASDDQGQTWQSVNISVGLDRLLTTGDLLQDVDMFDGAVSNGRLHCIFGCDFQRTATTGRPSGFHGAFYQAVEFDAQGQLVRVFPEERSLQAVATGTADVDFPIIAAEGSLVLCSWQDDRDDPRISESNNTFSRVSIDGGATFGAETRHTTRAQPLTSRPTRGEVCISGNTLFVFQGDTRNGNESVFASISQSVGVNWTDNVGISVTNSSDAEQIRCAASNGVVTVAYNIGGAIFAVQDRSNGADFLAGTQTEIQVNQSISELRNLDVRGDTIAISGEISGGIGIAYSLDGGRTYDEVTIYDGVAGDADYAWVTITENDDLQVAWSDNRLGTSGSSNLDNGAFTSGIKLPRLIDDTATRGGITYRGAPSENGNTVVLFPSLAAPASRGVVIDAAAGILVNFTPDSATAAAAGALPLFATTVQSGGANWPLPRLSRLVGMPVWYVAVPFDAAGATAGYTDPIRQDP